MTLGELNKNITKVGKALSKIAKGERLTGAGDGASDYAISEKMRNMLRTLNQDVRNTQNGASMLKVAEGGMQEIVDNLRSIRELAINAANDHNTDDDRRILQKDLDQRKENINEIASTTSYNNRLLLMGDYSENLKVGKKVYEPQYATVKEQVAVQVGTTQKQITVTTPSVTHIPGISGNPGVLIQNNNVDGFTDSLTPAYSSCHYNPNAKALYPYPSGTPFDVGFAGYLDNDFVNRYPSDAPSVIRSLVKDLATYEGTSPTDRLNHAISTATGGRFTSFSDLKTSFTNDLWGSIGGASISDKTKLLKDYCDIDLTNSDNGAITGSDISSANPTKSAEDIIDEGKYSDTSTWIMPTPGTTSKTPGGITVAWPKADKAGHALTSDAEFVMKGLNTVWLDKAWEQIQITYPGMFDNNNPARNIKVVFEDFNDSTFILGWTNIQDKSGKTTGFKIEVGSALFDNIYIRYLIFAYM